MLGLPAATEDRNTMQVITFIPRVIFALLVVCIAGPINRVLR
jgi:flagellar biosynthesis protein FliQ